MVQLILPLGLLAFFPDQHFVDDLCWVSAGRAKDQVSNLSAFLCVITSGGKFAVCRRVGSPLQLSNSLDSDLETTSTNLSENSLAVVLAKPGKLFTSLNFALPVNPSSGKDV
jgi:hypothetical protein